MMQNIVMITETKKNLNSKFPLKTFYYLMMEISLTGIFNAGVMLV